MSSQERWDVVLRFTDGPLSYQGDHVCRGPVVRMGANPGPGGLSLDGYRGLDNRHATITAYDGATVSIAPVGSNQVRVAPHENVDWNEIQVIRGPVYLDSGTAFHLGPTGRGCSAVFVECRRLGVWEKGQILSDSAQMNPDVQPSNVKELDTRRGIPLWFIPATILLFLSIAVAVTVPLIAVWQRSIQALGPVDDGEEYYKFVDVTVEVDPKLKDGLNQPFFDFVMKPNGTAAEWPELGKPENWDQRFYEYVGRSATVHAKAWKFWGRLEEVSSDYAFVVTELRDAGLPEVLAAVPYQESQYRGSAQSYVCAKGYWQFMPEVANRASLAVRDCKLKGSNAPWTPTRLVPVRGVVKNAAYVDNGTSCRITGCAVDERTDLQASTRGAIKLLAEAYNDEVLRSSGAVVQLTILSHNAGYDNSLYEEKQVNLINILPAYKRYLEKKGLERAPDVYGQNITCTTLSAESLGQMCEGVLWNETQHYAYNIVAQHMLAVCYYAENHAEEPAFAPWRDYARGDGYCTRMNVPTAQQVRERSGK